MLQLALVLDGDVVVSADPVVGFLHRGAEKLFEVRDYRQLVMLANRHDWLSAFSNELGIVLAVERMLGMQVPDRAVWLRTLLAELNRVLNHLLFLGAADPSRGAGRFAEREALQAVMEEATGGRVHFQSNRVGGLHEDVPRGWTDRVRTRAGRRAGRAAGAARRPTTGSATGVAVLAPAVVLAHGVSGPLARASGVDLDLRRDEPYLAYGELDVPVAVTRAAGDAAARFACVLDQVAGSLDLADACLDRLPAGAGGAAAAQDRQGAGGRDVRLDGEPARACRATTWSPAATGCRGGWPCARRRSTTSRRCRRSCPAPGWPTS